MIAKIWPDEKVNIATRQMFRCVPRDELEAIAADANPLPDNYSSLSREEQFDELCWRMESIFYVCRPPDLFQKLSRYHRDPDGFIDDREWLLSKVRAFGWPWKPGNTWPIEDREQLASRM